MVVVLVSILTKIKNKIKKGNSVARVLPPTGSEVNTRESGPKWQVTLNDRWP